MSRFAPDRWAEKYLLLLSWLPSMNVSVLSQPAALHCSPVTDPSVGFTGIRTGSTDGGVTHRAWLHLQLSSVSFGCFQPKEVKVEAGDWHGTANGRRGGWQAWRGDRSVTCMRTAWQRNKEVVWHLSLPCSVIWGSEILCKMQMSHSAQLISVLSLILLHVLSEAKKDFVGLVNSVGNFFDFYLTLN